MISAVSAGPGFPLLKIVKMSSCFVDKFLIIILLCVAVAHIKKDSRLSPFEVIHNRLRNRVFINASILGLFVWLKARTLFLINRKVYYGGRELKLPNSPYIYLNLLAVHIDAGRTGRSR